MIEASVYFTVPVLLAMLICWSGRNDQWFPKQKFLIGGLALGSLSALVGPTVLCCSEFEKVLAAAVIGLVVTLPGFLTAVSVCYLRRARAKI